MKRELLTTVGLHMPEDFSAAEYERFWRQVSSLPSSDAKTEAGFGWNAVAFRFLQTAGSDEAFRESLAEHGDAPPSEERYRQESLLFLFFVAGQASIESFSYALHAACSISNPQSFPMTNLRDITVGNTSRGCNEAFPNASVTARLSSLRSDPTWKEWIDLRNILAHRSAPGRVVSLSSGSPSAPSMWKVAGKLEIAPSLTANRRSWLAGILRDLMEASADLMQLIA